MPVPGVDPGINPGTRCTTVSDYLSMAYSGTDGRIMSGHDGAGKAFSVSLLTPHDGAGKAFSVSTLTPADPHTSST
jgi:hypothetical protein